MGGEAAGLRCRLVRLACVTAIVCLGSACTSAEPPPLPNSLDVTWEQHPVHTSAEPPRPAPVCPTGTERHERGGEGPDALAWWCARGDVRHGPFEEQSFDERSRSWYEIRGAHDDGERHGLVESEGFYAVEHSGRSRVFLRERYEHGRLIGSNEASVHVVLEATAPVATRRFVVTARGLAPAAQWEDEATVIGSFDVEVSATWLDAPAEASPSILRAELSVPGSRAPARADAILHPAADTEPPATDSSLPLGYLPTVTASWRACDPAGCELEVEVTLRWLGAQRGRADAYVTLRAVPDTWPESAPLDVRALDERSHAP